MRLARLLLIALSALLHQATVAQCQDDPVPELQPGDATQARPVSGAPSLTPPDDVEGSWIGDDAPAMPQPPASMQQRYPGYPAYDAAAGAQYAPPMYDEYAEKAAYMYGGHPQDYAGINFSGDPYAGYGGSGEYGECCGGCAQGHHCGGCACCGSDGPCGYLWNEVHSHRRFYLREEYLSWKAKGNPLPPLVTTSTDPNIPQEFAGVLGEPETEILYGGNRVNQDWRNGGRITAGMWLVDGEFLGIEGHYMGFEQSEANFFTDSPDILARPFTSVEEINGVVTETPASSLLTFPNYDDNGTIVDLNGQIRVTSKSDVQSAGLVLRKLMWIDFTQNWRIDGIAGYRFFRMDDGVRINDFWTETGGLVGTANFTSYDYFQARNEFHGGELGLIGSIYRGKWSLELMGKIALGNVHQTMKIDGTSFVSAAGGPYVETNNFRLLTQPTNDGRYKQNVFAVLPETNLNVRYDLTQNIRLMVGYNFLYLSQAQRSGKAIDLDVNPTQIGGVLVGPAVPDFKFRNDDGFWMHGVNAGLELRW